MPIDFVEEPQIDFQPDASPEMEKLKSEGRRGAFLEKLISGAESAIEPYTPSGLLNQPARLAGQQDPFAAGRPVIPIPEPKGTGVLAGLGKLGVRVVQSLETPEGLVTIPALPASRAIQALTAGQMAADTPEAVRQAIQVLRDPSAPLSEKIAATGMPIVQAASAALLARGHTKGVADALQERSTTPLPLENRPKVGQEVGTRIPQPETPPVPQETPVQEKVVTAATYTDPETGVTTTAPNHIEAAQKQGVEAPKEPEARETKDFGYQVKDVDTGQTENVTRSEGTDVARESGQLKEEPERGNQGHSNQIELAPSAIPESPTKQVETQPPRRFRWPGHESLVSKDIATGKWRVTEFQVTSDGTLKPLRHDLFDSYTEAVLDQSSNANRKEIITNEQNRPALSTTPSVKMDEGDSRGKSEGVQEIKQGVGRAKPETPIAESTATPPPPAEVEKAKGGEPSVTPLHEEFPVGSKVSYLQPGEGIVRKTGTVISHEKSGRLKVDFGGEFPDFVGDFEQPKPPQAPPSAKGTEVVPAKSGEVTPAVAKVQAEVQKVARTEGQRPAKEVKSELVARLEDSIKKAKSYPDLSKFTDPVEAKKAIGTVTIDIPGDGVFTVLNSKEALQTVLDRAKKISTQPTEPTRTPFPKVRPTGNIPAEIWVNSSEPTHDVHVSKAGPGKHEWEIRKGKQIELSGTEYFLTSDGNTFSVTEPNTGKFVGTGKNIKEAIESAKEKLKNWTPTQLQEAMDKNLAKTGKAPPPTALEPPTTPPSTGEGMAGGPGIVGMGGAVPSEFELSPQTPTSIKNATVDVERAKRGLPPAIQPIKRSFGEVWDRAMAMIDHDPGVQDSLIDSLRSKPRALTDVEDAMLLQRQVDLQNEYGKATRDLAQAYDDGRTDAVAEEKLRVARLSDDLLDLYNIGKKVGTETGRGLNARKMMAHEDFTLAKMELEKRLANNGKPLSVAQRAEIQALHDKINATQKAYDDYVASTSRKLAEAEVARVIAEQKAAAAPRFDQRILAQAEKIVQGMEKQAEKSSKALREMLSRVGTSPDPALIYHASVIGSARIARLGLDLAKLTDSMVADFGEKIRPFMTQIWAESNKILDNVTAKTPESVRRVVKKADLSETKQAIGENIKEQAGKGQKDKITWQVHKLARAFVEHGITDREQLIDAVHDVLKDAIPGITRRETMDAISGYGDYKQLTKDQISIRLRGMKGEMQQLAKLEDMAKGQPPLKSGVERRTPTEVERRLIKQVNDAKNKFQVPVQDPSTQLKSALDTLKTTLANRIKDYQERIANGDYAARPRREIQLDAEASRLKAENERVKKQFQRGVALDRLKNASRVERTGDWIAKWRRGFILSGPVTLGKLTTAALQRLAFTPAEEAIGGVIGKAIPGVASKAPREGGFNVKAEAKAITQGITQGMRDAWQTLKTGQSDLDVLYGKEALLPPSAIDFFGHVHGALKAPVKRAEFARSLEKRTQYAIANGVDLSDPLVQSRLVIDSYKDANRAIFQQDNRVITAYKRGLQHLESKDKITGQVPLAGKALTTTARVLLPIVKIPTNIVAETMQYALGSVTGSVRLARAYSKGIENLHPEEADLIMRQLKKGSLGAAVLMLGYLNPQVVGGYYQPGEKRAKGTPKAGTIQIYGVNVPSWAIHNPLLETLQIGATVRRVADSKLRKRDTENQGIGAGIAAGLVGLGEEVPFVRESAEISKALDPHERGAFMGELGKSLLVPQFVQALAKYTDPFTETDNLKRKPQTAWQHVEMGIPGLRQNVPIKTIRR